MAFIHWLEQLTDDYITSWANKGLLRRGRKQLEKHDLEQHWQLDASSASGRVDGHEQQLNGVGFDFLSCTCAATGPCYHLTCFVLGLQRLAESQLASEESVESCEGNALPEPWLVDEFEQLSTLVGKSHLTRAIRGWHQQTPYTLETQKDGLHAVVHEKALLTLFIPRHGGLDASLCSCKQARCAHRALIVLAANVDHGLTVPEADGALDEWQRYALAQTLMWLQGLVNRGVSAVTRLQLSQGKALVTELAQADCPKVSQRLSALVTLLAQEQQGVLSSSVQRIRRPLAMTTASVTALLMEPLPQPYLALAGEHRRAYHIFSRAQFIGICAEIWQTLSGYRGYTVHCWHEQAQRFCQFSEARNQNQDVDWQPASAIQHALLGDKSLMQLMDAQFEIMKGWMSQSGRLSLRQGTLVGSPKPITSTAVLALETPLSALAQRFKSAMREDIFTTEPLLAIVPVQTLSETRLDQYTQQWRADGEDRARNAFVVRLVADAQGNRLAAKLNRYNRQARAVFGRWSIENGRLVVYPIALWADKIISLSLD